MLRVQISKDKYRVIHIYSIFSISMHVQYVVYKKHALQVQLSGDSDVPIHSVARLVLTGCVFGDYCQPQTGTNERVYLRCII